MLFSTIYQYRKLYPLRPAKIHQLVQSCPNRPTRIEYIVDKYDAATFDVFGEFGAVYDRVGSDGGEIVAIECDVDDAVKRLRAFVSFDLIAKAFGQRNASTAYPNEVDIFGAVVRLNYLCRQSRKGPLHAGFIHYPGFFNEVCFVSHSRANRNKRTANIKINDLSFGK